MVIRWYYKFDKSCTKLFNCTCTLLRIEVSFANLLSVCVCVRGLGVKCADSKVKYVQQCYHSQFLGLVILSSIRVQPLAKVKVRFILMIYSASAMKTAYSTASTHLLATVATAKMLAFFALVGLLNIFIRHTL